MQLTTLSLCVIVEKRKWQIHAEHKTLKCHNGLNCWDFQPQLNSCRCYAEVIIRVRWEHLFAIDKNLNKHNTECQFSPFTIH